METNTSPSLIPGILSAAAIGLCVFFTYVLFRIIRSDFRAAQAYKSAFTCMGRVKMQREDFRIPRYGSGLIAIKKIRYYQYEVEFTVDGTAYTGIVQSRTKGLIPGAPIQVHYSRDAAGNPKIETPVYAGRLKELWLGVIGGILLSAVIIMLKQAGRI